MTQKEIFVIQNAITHAAATISILACENYPHTAFEDRDFEDAYYNLVKMSIAIREKADGMDAEKEE